jgi:hypothetical protein
LEGKEGNEERRASKRARRRRKDILRPAPYSRYLDEPASLQLYLLYYERQRVVRIVA